MNGNYRPLWIIIGLLIVINIASLGSLWMIRGKQHEPDSRNRTGRMDRVREFRQGEFIPKRLGFSTAQTAAFTTLTRSHRTQLTGIMRDIRSLREQLMDQVGSNDRDTADDLIVEIGKKHEALEMVNFTHFQNVMELCDQDQKESFRRIMRRGFQRMDPGMDRGRTREPPGRN